jgi:hypothetical protein
MDTYGYKEAGVCLIELCIANYFNLASRPRLSC